MNKPLSDSLDLIELTSVINKRFLKHNGDYQRLLVLKTNNIKASSNTEITAYHYADSEEGKKMANNILKMFDNNSIKHKSIDEYSRIFTDFEDISFAKNILPAITFIEMGTHISTDKKTLKVSSNKKNIADLITNGLLLDYSKLDFEDN